MAQSKVQAVEAAHLLFDLSAKPPATARNAAAPPPQNRRIAAALRLQFLC